MRPCYRLLSAFALLLAARDAAGDVYMQCPPGGNNRLDEGGGNRNNNNRLMDTQNNAKGGYGYSGSANNGNQNNGQMGDAEPLKYYAGSKLPVTWTSQHSCGTGNAECQIVVQYMCNDAQGTPGGPYGANQATTGVGEGPVRDGTNNNAPDPNNANQNRGLHEPTSFYKACQNRQRNQGLYTADQNLNGNQATRTRQNPNGARSGLECPEERDYYPYWAPSPWKDLAIMTNNLALCNWYRSESQNVKARGYCSGTGNNNIPWDQTACTAAGGTWNNVPAWGIPAPECIAAPETRDNHLGNDRTGEETVVYVTVPSNAGTTAGGAATDVANRCVLRLRYNITTADTRVCSISGQTTKESCEAAGGIWSAHYLDSSYNDKDLTNNPPLPNQNPTVDIGGALTGGGGTNSLLELAINTNQYGRTFQDRTHTFSIDDRPPRIAANTVVHNLNVCGKRGNIVQTYPATEYRMNSEHLVVGASDMIHVQWTGNDNTNNNGNNNGEGTNNEDRHNIAQSVGMGLNVPASTADLTRTGTQNMFDVAWEYNSDTSADFTGARDAAALQKQFNLAKQTNCDPSNQVNNDQQNGNCEKLNRAKATVDLGLVRMKPGANQKPANYKYMSTRNKNFSNRNMAAEITVLADQHAKPPPPLNVTAWPEASTSDNKVGKIGVSWQPPGLVNNDGTYRPYIGTDGKRYYGYEQQSQEAQAYYVQYSDDGGRLWTAAPGCSVTSCTPPACTCNIEGLPAGTPISVRVMSAGEGGMSVSSNLAVAQTNPSSLSQSCANKLEQEALGKGNSTAATAAIVVGVLAGVCLALCLGWVFFLGGKDYLLAQLRPPPPPPPDGKFDSGMTPSY